MMWTLSRLLLIAVVLPPSLVHAAPNGCAPKVKEAIPPPRGWVKYAAAPEDYIIKLRIGLPQPNFHILEQHLHEVSDPDHERYGAHLSKEQVEELVAPHEDSVTLVNKWLEDHGLQEADISRSPANDWITISVPVSLAEKMLDTTYHTWKHIQSNEALVRTTSYSLPEHLHEHIDVIQPTTIFARTKTSKTTPRLSDGSIKLPADMQNPGVEVDPSCNDTITISCLKQLYNAVGFEPSATNGNQIGITGYLEQFANVEDLQSFYKLERPDAVNSTFNVTLINDGLNNQTLSEAGSEADLDVQFAFGLSFPIPRIFFSTGGRATDIPDSHLPPGFNEPYLEWLDFVLSQKTLPQTISTSYGDDEQTVPKAYAQRVCNGFAQLGARGVSLLFSSGDGGVGDGDPDPATQKCLTNDGRNITRFIPSFPASCPYVTAVGGTTFIPEVGIDFSGGGFSDFFARPLYQDAVVDKFFTQFPKGRYDGLFNPAGRAIPDVSAQSNNFLIVFQGVKSLIGGTSASSPTFAGIVSLLNDARISNKLPPLGFLNPLLYSKGINAFNDITIGNNPGCGTPGFNATEGWDPVTGLGTPDFRKLEAVVLSA